jgi:hypothetical protein
VTAVGVRGCGKIVRVKPAARNKYLAFACCALGALSVASAVATAAVVRGSGDPGTISFYKQSRAAMEGYKGIAFLGGGTSYKVVQQSGGDVFKFDFGATPKGYSAAVAHVRVVQHKGVVTEEVDTLVAPGEPALRLWQSAGTEIGELLTSNRCPELVPTNSASFTTLGHHFVLLHGTFAALQPGSSGLSVVASSYPLAGGTARERDTINASTHLWQASRLLVVGGPYNGNSLSESAFTYSHSLRFMPPPKLETCR